MDNDRLLPCFLAPNSFYAIDASRMSFRTFPQIESERLVLRLLEQSDLEQVICFWKENQDHLMPYGPKWPADFLSSEFWSRQIERNQQEFQSDISVRLFIFEKSSAAVSDEIVGNASLGGILRGAAQFCYLGYGLAQSKQKRGYMTEILPHLIDYAFVEMNLHRIMANYIPSNEASGRLLKRLGFITEGSASKYLYLNGKWEDHILTSITNQKWVDRDLNEVAN